ncbi:MAG: hypothetical protein KF831_10240 [Acidobacteria bacterium]|nr:hypothetical protein [Acidobacteriota bacterium]
MRRILLLFALIAFGVAVSLGQTGEPEFIGEALLVRPDGSTVKLDKEIGDFTSGISWSSNSWNALSLEIAGGKALTRIKTGEPIELIVRAVDNNSDPLTIIAIYKFKAKKKSRSVLLSKDNSGTFLKSRTSSKNMVRFTGSKSGLSSYRISLTDLPAGEYGILVSNPNNRDEKRTIVSCFAVE